MDVKTAFLKWIFIKEELYMMQPEGFVNPKGANKMCKLQRFIDGLVQASQSWNICFDELIKNIVLYRLVVSLYLQESEWEHYSLSDKYM